MPCYDPPENMARPERVAVDPYVETLREIDKYCIEGLSLAGRQNDAWRDLHYGTIEALKTIQDMVHARFRSQSLSNPQVHPDNGELSTPDEYVNARLSVDAPSPIRARRETPIEVLQDEITGHKQEMNWHADRIVELRKAITKLEETGHG